MQSTVVSSVFPFVSFTNVEGKQFCIPRESVIHTETYCARVGDREVPDSNKTYVNFKSPNPKSKGALHAVVDMPLELFREQVLRPAYQDIIRNT